MAGVSVCRRNLYAFGGVAAFAFLFLLGAVVTYTFQSSSVSVSNLESDDGDANFHGKIKLVSEKEFENALFKVMERHKLFLPNNLKSIENSDSGNSKGPMTGATKTPKRVDQKHNQQTERHDEQSQETAPHDQKNHNQETERHETERHETERHEEERHETEHHEQQSQETERHEEERHETEHHHSGQEHTEGSQDYRQESHFKRVDIVKKKKLHQVISHHMVKEQGKNLRLEHPSSAESDSEQKLVDAKKEGNGEEKESDGGTEKEADEAMNGKDGNSKRTKPLIPTEGENTCSIQLPMETMELWLRSDTLKLSNDERVYRWRDVSGNGRDVVQRDEKELQQPRFWKTSSANGWPTVNFNGGQILASETFWEVPSEEATIFVVGMFHSKHRAAIIGSGIPEEASYRLFVDATDITMNTNIPNVNSPVAPIPQKILDFQITTAVFAGPRSSLRRNGVRIDSQFYSTLQSFLSKGMLSIGGSSEEVEHSYLKGHLLEIILYSGILKEKEMRSVEMYLSDRYSIALGIVREMNEIPHQSDGPPQFTIPDWVVRGVKRIENLAMWVSSSEIDVEDRSRVTEWRDLSGHRRHLLQDNDAFRPLFISRSSASGWPSVRFAGENYLFTRDPWELKSEEMTLFILGRYEPGEQSCVFGPASKGARDQFYAIISNLKGLIMATHNADQSSPLYTVGVDQSKFALLHAVFNGPKSLLAINDGDGRGTGASNLVKFRPESLFALGACVSTSSPMQFVVGDITEVMVFDGLLSQDDLRHVLNYFHLKYPFLRH